MSRFPYLINIAVPCFSISGVTKAQVSTIKSDSDFDNTAMILVNSRGQLLFYFNTLKLSDRDGKNLGSRGKTDDFYPKDEIKL